MDRLRRCLALLICPKLGVDLAKAAAAATARPVQVAANRADATELCATGDTAGKRLAEFRKSLGLSQKKFAMSLGFSGGLVGQLEADLSPPSRAFLQKISDIYGVSSDWLLNGRGAMVSDDGGADFDQRLGDLMKLKGDAKRLAEDAEVLARDLDTLTRPHGEVNS
jgi:transcriptional regulator with XRE-family HTH domain